MTEHSVEPEPNSGQGDAIPAHIPRRIDDYELLRLIGEGGMGLVFLAWDPTQQRRVALKIVRPELEDVESTRERFEREIRSISRLRHPGIVPVLASGTFEGHPYYVMEFVDGETLAAVLQRARTIDPEQLRGCDMVASTHDDDGQTQHSDSATSWALRSGTWEDACAWIARDIALALAHAHSAGVLHRDLKPANVMIDAAGQARLLDFGLARLDDAQTLTHPDLAIGSLAYMPPELFLGSGHARDERLDVYGIGILLYEMLTLAAPFRDAHDPRRVQALVLSGSAPRPRSLRATIPARLETVCAQAMHADLRKRTASASDVVRALDRYVSQPVRTRLPARFLTAAVLISALLGAGLAWWASEPTRSAPAVTDPPPAPEPLHASSSTPSSGDPLWIHEAAEALRLGDSQHARATLGTVPESQRDWEWHYLNDCALTPELIRQDTGYHPYTLASDPVTGAVTAVIEDRSIVTWSRTGVELRRWDGPPILGPALTADGRFMIGTVSHPEDRMRPASSNPGVSVVDCADFTRRQLDTEGQPTALAWAQDSGCFVLGFAGGDCAVFDRTSLRKLHHWSTGCDAFYWTGLAFSPSGNKVLAGGRSGRTVLYDLASGSIDWVHELSQEVRNVHWHASGDWLTFVVGLRSVFAMTVDGAIAQVDHRDNRVLGLAIDSKRGVVWTGDEFGWIDGWFIRNGRRTRRYRLQNVEVDAMRFDEHADRLLISGEERGIWQLESSKAHRHFDTGSEAHYRNALFHPSFGILAIATDAHPSLLDLETRTVRTLRELPWSRSGALVDAASVVLAPTTGPTLQRFDLETLARTAVSPSLGIAVQDLAYLPRDAALAGACADGTVRIWDSQTLEERTVLRGHRGAVHRVAVGADGSVFSGGEDGALRHWSIDAGSSKKLLQAEHGIFGICVDSEGDRAFAASSDGILHGIEISTQRVDWQRKLIGGVQGLTLNSERTRLASIDSLSTTLRVWDSATGRPILHGFDHGAEPNRVLFVPTSGQFATLDADGIIRLY